VLISRASERQDRFDRAALGQRDRGGELVGTFRERRDEVHPWRGRGEQRGIVGGDAAERRVQLVDQLREAGLDPRALSADQVWTMPGDTQCQRERHLGRRVGPGLRCLIAASERIIPDHVHRQPLPLKGRSQLRQVQA